MSPATHRDRIIASAIRITSEEGWTAITMSRLAADVGVSRQTVYNEVGSKPALAEAMVLTELAAFLAVVDRAFDENSDPVAAVRQAVRGVLTLGRTHPLLAVILSPGTGAESDLLPAITTRASSVIDLAQTAVDARLVAAAPHLSGRERRAATDMIVRTVLSHLVQPGGSPATAADDVAWVASRVLAPTSR